MIWNSRNAWLLDDLPRALRILNAGDLDDDAIVALLLHHRLGDAEALDASAHRLQRAIDRVRDLVWSDRLLGLVDLEREVRAALKIQSLSQRNVALDVSRRHAVCAALLDFDVAREERHRRKEAERDDGADAVLQIGHATAGRKGGFRAASKVISRLRLGSTQRARRARRVELGDERVRRIEAHGVPQAAHELDADTAQPYQSPLASNRCTSSESAGVAEGRTRPEVHHSAEGAALGVDDEPRIPRPAEEVCAATERDVEGRKAESRPR